MPETTDAYIEKDAGWHEKTAWTSVPNRIVRDDSLSWDARGMLTYFASHSDRWQVRMADLERAGKSGRARTRRIIHELEEAGYLIRRQSRDDPGRFSVTCYYLRSSRSEPVVSEPPPGNPMMDDLVVGDAPAGDSPAVNRPPYRRPFDAVDQGTEVPTPSADADAPPRDDPQPPLPDLAPDPVEAGVQPSQDRKITRKQLAEHHWPEFWTVYGHKQAKRAARTAWDRAIVGGKGRDPADPQEVINAAKRYRGTFNGDRKFMKHPASWLNGGCWEDELPVQPGELLEGQARLRLRQLMDTGDAETAAQEAGVRWGGWPRLSPDERRGDGLVRWGREWIREHEADLLVGMTRSAA